MSLAMVEEGKKVKVKRIVNGRRLNKRLNDLGIYEGTDVKVVKNDNCGPIILKVLDSKLAIGRGMAHKIIVE